MAVKPDEFERLTYRGLAERFGISPDAARMKAKRKAKIGAWRIIPGNHPSDAVQVEIPIADLNGEGERVAGVHAPIIRGERNPRTQPPEQATLVQQALTSLAAAQDRIRELTDQLVEAKEAHRRDAMELVAAETREMGTKAELERALDDLAALEKILRSSRRSWWQRTFGHAE